MLLTADLKTHLYTEQITAISRNDTELMEEAIAAAIVEAQGYLSRYDIDTIFATTGTDRDKALLMWLKDIATWHFITLANAGADLEFRQERYKQAIKSLEKIQSGKIVPNGWPLVTEEAKQDLWKISSDPKRETKY